MHTCGISALTQSVKAGFSNLNTAPRQALSRKTGLYDLLATRSEPVMKLDCNHVNVP